MNDKYQRIYDVVKQIPEGCVASYGQVAKLAGLPRHARMVGYALHALKPGNDVPWHRVINSQGKVSPRADPAYDGLQQQILEQEGVIFRKSGRVDWKRFGWLSECPKRRNNQAADRPRGPASARRRAPLAPAPRSGS